MINSFTLIDKEIFPIKITESIKIHSTSVWGFRSFHLTLNGITIKSGQNEIEKYLKENQLIDEFKWKLEEYILNEV